ncbi:hypothetical protein [Amaricoccus sp.]|uniref:hypothetical protein n=1 Tax=Amaricoccus sp. TaxID=1872485 RepID=UPI0026067E01|nr:hypothetical protein [Amaricoccus sp.]HRO11387.1 hypothetical protein [Amaricoccus sp.]
MGLGPRTWEAIAQWVMVAGIVALLQPWSLFLHRYGVTITLIGLAGFIVFSHVSSRPGEK